MTKQKEDDMLYLVDVFDEVSPRNCQGFGQGTLNLVLHLKVSTVDNPHGVLGPWARCKHHAFVSLDDVGTAKVHVP